MRADAFSASTSACSPTWRLCAGTDDHVELRAPLVGAHRARDPAGTVALVAAIIGSTSFDGFSNGAPWLLSSTPASQSSSRASASAPTRPSSSPGRVGLLLA